MRAIQRLYRKFCFFYYSLRAVARPSDLQNVLKLANVQFSSGELTSLMSHCVKHRPSVFQDQFRFRPKLDKLAHYPEGSLGRAYFEFIRTNKIRPEEIQAPSLQMKENEFYIFRHFYETHDLWHVLTGFDVSVEGELTLQAFYLAQAPTPLAPLLMGLGLLRECWVDPAQAQSLFHAIANGYQQGLRAQALYGVDWESQLDEELTLVQKRYGVGCETEISIAA